MAISKSQAKATAKYEKNNYFKTLVRFKKEDEERIRAAAGDSLNGFIVKCVLDALDKVETPAQVPILPVEAVKPAKPSYLPPTPENLQLINFAQLKTSQYYKGEVVKLFGEKVTTQLCSMSEEEFKNLVNSSSEKN